MLLEGFKISWLVWSILTFWLVHPRSKQLDPSSLPASTPSRSHEAEEVNLFAALLNVNQLWVDWEPSQHTLCTAPLMSTWGKWQKIQKKKSSEVTVIQSQDWTPVGMNHLQVLEEQAKFHCKSEQKKSQSLTMSPRSTSLATRAPRTLPLWAASQLCAIIPAFLSLQLTLGRITEALESTTHAKVRMGKAGSS